MRRLFIFLFILVTYNSTAQVDPHKLDSLKNSINAEAKKMQAWQDSFREKQDSIYRQQLSLPTENVQQVDDEERKNKQPGLGRQVYVRLLLAVLVLAVLVLLLVRNRKKAGN